MEQDDDRGIPIDAQTIRLRQRSRRRLLFVVILTSAVLVFALVVAVWMYWIAGLVQA